MYRYGALGLEGLAFERGEGSARLFLEGAYNAGDEFYTSSRSRAQQGRSLKS